MFAAWWHRVRGPVASRSLPDSVIAAESVGKRLTVAVHKNDITTIVGVVECWTYVSDGLSRLGQKEVALSIRRGANEAAPDFPKAPFEFFRLLNDLAQQGRVVDVGDITALGPDGPGLLDDARIRGVVYALPDPINDRPFAAPTIAAIPVTAEEADVALRFGTVRLAALLGDRYRRFPTAVWYERDRPPVITTADMQDSILTKVPGIRAAGVHVYMRGIEMRRAALPPTGSLENAVANFVRQEVVWALPTSLASQFADAFGQNGERKAFVIFARPDDAADACLCWRAGAIQPYAITSLTGAGTHIAGNHLLLVPGQQVDSVSIVEDGFAIMMTDGTFDELRRQLAGAAENWGMPVTGEMGFRLKTSAGSAV